MTKSFTGRARRKKTHWSVRVSDRFSKSLITIGGIGTILAVSTVFFYLLYVTIPLFRPAHISGSETLNRPVVDSSKPLSIQSDEYGLMNRILYADGRLICTRLDTGALLSEQILFTNASLTAFTMDAATSEVLCGFSDGSIQMGRINFLTSYVSDKDLPPELQALGENGTGEWNGALIQRISGEQFRSIRLSAVFEEPIPGETSAAVRLLDQTTSSAGQISVMLNDEGTLSLLRFTKRENIMTGKVTVRRTAALIPYNSQERRDPPAWIFISGLGDTVCAVWRDGTLLRFDTRNMASPSLIERIDLVPEPDRQLTSLQPLLGRATLLVGDSTGRIQAWFPAFSPNNSSQTFLALAHTFQGSASVTALASSSRIRMVAAGYADGTVDLFHITSQKQLAHLVAGDSPVQAIALTPKDDGLLALTPSRLVQWGIDPQHPEITPSALFTPVWYEGSAKPEHVWQSSSGTDDFEPKFGLMPLIFGTLKATLFSMMFGVPIALLAAIFTSEFLSPRAKLHIKPAVEMMAGLPSVVLGFIAALVLAPIVASMLTVFMTVFVTVPASFLLGAYIWQLLPQRWTLLLARFRLIFLLLTVPAGVGLAWVVSPVIERLCFAGDIMRWLDGQIGQAFGGWVLLLMPATCLIVAWVFSLVIDPRLRSLSMDWSRLQCALIDLFKFMLGCAVALALAIASAALLQVLGFDPRGGLFGTYVQRNALVVGFVMGFAIIPIIYTISEDALSSVPDHLRSASLGAGATPWQTAVRIIIPTAMSGLFSAIMIGLGRAVGETMIVLMAAGNTPVMEWNIFNGFRTLSANIAVELPEAVRNSTHYRTLFLAALALFVITFILNTIAELIRIRFRKKAVEL
ncbi:MAG: ABC transporter permease subunit [Verrucomicrobia bacterium]|nr:ABC transporter permease subunit [Verrucomicrobiota bacterium]